MDTRENIIRTAADLFLSNGVKKVKMDNIALMLKISKRTIYQYFKNKDSLIRESIDLIQNEQNDINSKLFRESENVIEAVLGLLINGSELLDKTNPLYYTDLQRLYPRIWNEKIRQSKAQSYKLILKLLKKGKQDGIYRDDINAEIIALILIEQLYMLSDQKIVPANKFSVVEVYEHIIINMTRGIATEKGLELLKNTETPADE